ncbi:hypothetical protein TNCV_3279661 [Trichonephila clavipes]|nr:hypothetical protein TNCV_3279661 [Trichonephila clavipes]
MGCTPNVTQKRQTSSHAFFCTLAPNIVRQWILLRGLTGTSQRIVNNEETAVDQVQNKFGTRMRTIGSAISHLADPVH